ncbi:MAG: hypothetical protein ACXWUN_06445 [Allosphingosinicella sp.]
MNYQPAVPEAGQSPYPLQSPPLTRDASNGAEIAEAESDEAADEAPGSGEAPAWRRPATLGAGAAIGIGSAALVAALLYARRSGSSDRGDATKDSGATKRKSKAEPA